MSQNISLERGKRAGNMLLAQTLVTLILGAIIILTDGTYSSFWECIIAVIIGGAIEFGFSFIIISPLKKDKIETIRKIYVFFGSVLFFSCIFTFLINEDAIEFNTDLVALLEVVLIIIALHNLGKTGKILCNVTAGVSLGSTLFSLSTSGFSLLESLGPIIVAIMHAAYLVYLGLYIESKGVAIEKCSELLEKTEEQINNGKVDYDELIKLKELSDKGVITPEEYDKKKKQILGL